MAQSKWSTHSQQQISTKTSTDRVPQQAGHLAAMCQLSAPNHAAGFPSSDSVPREATPLTRLERGCWLKSLGGSSLYGRDSAPRQGCMASCSKYSDSMPWPEELRVWPKQRHLTNNGQFATLVIGQALRLVNVCLLNFQKCIPLALGLCSYLCEAQQVSILWSGLAWGDPRASSYHCATSSPKNMFLASCHWDTYFYLF